VTCGNYSQGRFIFIRAIQMICLIALALLCHVDSALANQSRVISRSELGGSHRDDLADKLRRITGWQDLDFGKDGGLILGKTQPVGGSQTARELLAAAVAGKNLMVLEDASRRQDVVFCRVVEGRWTGDQADKPPVFVILIDFEDFAHLMGEEAALASFNVGWGVLHEIDHVVNDADDPTREGETGECEALINRMRRECGLAERAEYHFNFVPGTQNSEFKTRFVRIAFDQYKAGSNKKKRAWLIWDADLVGGLDEQKLLASRL
jgi:hypothetical protein